MGLGTKGGRVVEKIAITNYPMKWKHYISRSDKIGQFLQYSHFFSSDSLHLLKYLLPEGNVKSVTCSELNNCLYYYCFHNGWAPALHVADPNLDMTQIFTDFYRYFTREWVTCIPPFCRILSFAEESAASVSLLIIVDGRQMISWISIASMLFVWSQEFAWFIRH